MGDCIDNESITPDKNFFKNTPDHVSRYVYASKFVENKTILDAACGRGYGTDFISRRAKKVMGVDLNDTFIHFAKTHYSKDNLEFIRSDVTRIPLENSYFDMANPLKQ